MKRKEDSAGKLMAALQAAAPHGRTMIELAGEVGVAVGTISVLLSLLRRSGVPVRQRSAVRTGTGSYGRCQGALLFFIEGQRK